MNVRKLMGRLNAASPSYEIGRGGIPELTPQDIAAALGMISDEMAREVFASIWWPDGASLTCHTLRSKLMVRLLTEAHRRKRAVEEAELHYQIAEALPSQYRSVEHHRALVRGQAVFEKAKKEVWPKPKPKGGKPFGVYSRILESAMNEVGVPGRCLKCGGRGSIGTVTGLKSCDKCEGSGVSALSKSARAAKLGITEGAYRSIWQPVYDWTYQWISGMESSAARLLADRLGAENYSKAA